MCERNGQNVRDVMVEKIYHSFMKQSSTLSRDAIVEKEGHIRFHTSLGANFYQ